MYYLPPRKNRWKLAMLHVPATWPGGAREIKVRVDYGSRRVIGGHVYVWTQITSRTDTHHAYGTSKFVAEDMITGRGVNR